VSVNLSIYLSIYLFSLLLLYKCHNPAITAVTSERRLVKLAENEKGEERDCGSEGKIAIDQTTTENACARASVTNSAIYFSVILLNLSI
jgi:hypothetical protein